MSSLPPPAVEELEVSGREKAWGVVIGLLVFPVGLIALVGLLLNRSWGRWLGLFLGLLAGFGWAVAAVWLVAVVLPGSSYPFAPWFVFLAALAAGLGFLAARAFQRGIRASRAPEPGFPAPAPSDDHAAPG
jgi:hypothetical protein